MIKKTIRMSMSKIKGNSWNKEYSIIKKIIDKSSLQQFQEEYLKRLLLHTYKKVPYYTQDFKKIRLIDDDIIDLSRLNKIQILTKVIMRNNKGLISKDYTTRKWYYNSSGGSTGEPIKFIQDETYDKWGNATFHYYYKNILGIDEQNVRKVILWGSERDIFKKCVGFRARINNWIDNKKFLNSFRMTEGDLNNYIKKINSYKPYLIRGYASSLYELCRYAEKKDIIVHKPEIVVSTAETLKNGFREKIETVFRTKVYDYYGSREANNLAGECKEGLLHVFTFHNYIEILNNDNLPINEDEEGRIIVTNLHNFSMPFIRYEIGDMAVLGPEKCKCGSVLPTLKRITGRISDHFVKKDGTIIHGEYFTHLFFLKDWVKAFQVVQEDYDKIRIFVTPVKEINVQEKKDIENKIKFAMGQDCKIIWEFIEEIPTMKSGKYLYTKSLIQG